MKWQPFYWDSNQHCGLINSPEDWAVVVEAYNQPSCADVSELANAKEHPHPTSDIPHFGFRIEHDGDLTLKDWADANQLTLQSVNDT